MYFYPWLFFNGHSRQSINNIPGVIQGSQYLESLRGCHILTSLISLLSAQIIFCFNNSPTFDLRHRTLLILSICSLCLWLVIIAVSKPLIGCLQVTLKVPAKHKADTHKLFLAATVSPATKGAGQDNWNKSLAFYFDQSFVALKLILEIGENH